MENEWLEESAAQRDRLWLVAYSVFSVPFGGSSDISYIPKNSHVNVLFPARGFLFSMFNLFLLLKVFA